MARWTQKEIDYLMTNYETLNSTNVSHALYNLFGVYRSFQAVQLKYFRENKKNLK